MVQHCEPPAILQAAKISPYFCSFRPILYGDVRSLLEEFMEALEALVCARVDWNAKSLSKGALLMDLAVVTLVQVADIVEADLCRNRKTVNVALFP